MKEHFTRSLVGRSVAVAALLLLPLAVMAGWQTGPGGASLGGVSASGYVQNFSQGLYFWLSAQQALLNNPTATNGQTVPILDYSPNNWGVSNGWFAGAVTLARDGVNGLPAFSFPASTGLMVSNLFCGLTNGPLLIEITFRDAGGDAQGQNFMLAAGGFGSSAPRKMFFRGWVDNSGTMVNGEAGAYSGGELDWGINGAGGAVTAGVQPAQFLPEVVVLGFDGSNAWETLDGHPTYDDRIQSGPVHVGALVGCTNLYIGSDVTAGSYFNGFIFDLRIYTNTSPAFERSLENYCCNQIPLPSNVMNVDGDSISQGIHTWTLLGTLQQILAPSLPGWAIDTEAFSGRNTTQMLTNLTVWAPFRGQAINAVCLMGSVNDFSPGNWVGANAIALGQSNQVAATAANITNYVLTCVSNGMEIAVCTLPSVYWETNSLLYMGYDWRSNLNQRIRAVTNFGADVIDYAADIPAMGSNYAFLATNWVAGTALFNVDQTHPTSLGYTNLAAVALPVWQYLAYGQMCESVNTSVPPFSLTLPLTDIYQGHSYYNSNQTWMIVK